MVKSKPSTGKPGEDNCRAAIADDEIFENVQRCVAGLRGRIERDAVFQVLADGLTTRLVYEQILDPKWCADRDQALARIERAIRGLKQVVGGRGPLPNFPDWTAGLEREYRKLLGNRTMTMSRESEGWTQHVGRPKAVWRHETEKALRELGVAKLKRDDLIEAAGLIAERRKRPTRPSSR
jgi:hypothetical protein